MADGRSIVLTQVQPFWLGAIYVDPPTRRIGHGERFEILEPRVMQVLVVLAEANGSVVSRDELIERCWSGRIVSENAINRVISRIRQAASECGVDAFHLETITKVGYRVVSARDMDSRPFPDNAPPPSAPPPTVVNDDSRTAYWRRRQILVGGAVGVAAVSAGLWKLGRKAGHQPPPEAREFHRLGQIAQRQGVPEQVHQAISFFRQATQIDPGYADAWGGLALAYRHILEGYAEGEKGSLPALIESAARRALTLDPDNADAQVALVLVRPGYRNWGAIEAKLIALAKRFPKHWFVLAQLGIIRYEVGRWREGLPFTERQMALDPYIPIPYYMRARALWAQNRLQEAESMLAKASDQWPTNPMFWSLRFDFLIAQNRPESAVSLIMNPDVRPSGVGPVEIEERLGLIRAISGNRPADTALAVERVRKFERQNIQAAPAAATLFALLRRPDLALACIERYYFGADDAAWRIPPPGPFDRRYCAFLFMPMMQPLWSAPRFVAMLQRSGLEDYWRRSGTRPDFRA